MIADAFTSVCLNTSIFPSVSDFIPQSTDCQQYPQGPSSTCSLSRTTTVPPRASTPALIDPTHPIAPTTTHAAIIMYSVATTRGTAKGMTTI